MEHLPQTDVSPAQKLVRTIAPAPISNGCKPLRVAGYCRTSTAMECQQTSIEAQRTYYRNLILSHPNWELVDIYWEVGVSATKAETRPELQRLISDCRAGRIDMVIVKSISRFSRNIVDCLELTRSLTEMGVILRFDKEGLETGRGESELMLSVLSALAQDESRSLSSNMKWAIRKRFEAGTYLPPRAPYGYRKLDGRFVIHTNEAAVVRRIFRALIDGRGTVSIAKDLNAQNVPTWSQANGQAHNMWRASTVRSMAHNRFYTGDALYQKSFMDEKYRKRKNTGQLDQYLHVANHPAIVDRVTFSWANAMLERCEQERKQGRGGSEAAKPTCTTTGDAPC